MNRRSLLLGIVVLLLLAAGPSRPLWADPPDAPATQPPGGPAELWFIYGTNLLVDKNVADLEPIWRRAAAAGYTHVLLTDSKFARLDQLPVGYFRNVEKVKKLAGDLHLQLVPAVFPLGYSEAMLAHDPNLAEAMPVRDALLIVNNGQASLAPDQPAGFPSPENFADLSRWDWYDKPAVVVAGGEAKVENPNGRNARVVREVKLAPFRQYHLSVQVRTANFRGTPQVAVLAKEKQDGKDATASLNYADLGVARTQDWKVHDVVFNSLDHSQVSIYLGCWDGQTGTLEWRNPRLEEVALVNLVRRDGAPLVIRRDGDGAEKPALVEGAEYRRVVDPHMGNVPWPGAYEVWHPGPAVKTSLPDGTRLRVSYYHAVVLGGGAVMICPSEKRTVELLQDEAQRVHRAFGAGGYFMSHDEIRILDWDKSCQDRGLTPGQILADNLRTCEQILTRAAPDARQFVWSDMFDPNHNAVDHYYLVHGDLADSWQGLDKSVIVAVWYFEKRDASMKFFADRGNKLLLAGYYDAAPDRIEANVRGWLDSARKLAAEAHSQPVVGIMYTTWRNNYADLEKFAQLVRSSK